MWPLIKFSLFDEMEEAWFYEFYLKLFRHILVMTSNIFTKTIVEKNYTKLAKTDLSFNLVKHSNAHFVRKVYITE